MEKVMRDKKVMEFEELTRVQSIRNTYLNACIDWERIAGVHQLLRNS